MPVTPLSASLVRDAACPGGKGKVDYFDTHCKGLLSRAKTNPTAAQSPPLQAPMEPPQAAARQDASKLPNEPN